MATTSMTIISAPPQEQTAPADLSPPAIKIARRLQTLETGRAYREKQSE